MANADVEIRLRLNNQASQGIKKAEQDTQRGAEKTATATERASARAAAAATRGANMQRSAFQRMSQAREQLGIRSERTIQREIDRTRAAYQRLSQSGTMTWREQARAADQMRQRVTQLTNEMGKLTARQKAMGALKIGASVAAGGVAAGMVLSKPVREGMAFEERLAYMATHAFSERDKAGKKLGKDELRAAINGTAGKYAMSQDSTAQALDTLITSSVMTNEKAMALLPELAKAAAASGADITTMAQTFTDAVGTGFLSADDIPNALNMIAAGGAAGGFNFEKMLQSLPHMLGVAKASGMSGKEDFGSLVALYQSSKRTSGDEASATGNMEAMLRLMGDKSVAEHIKKTTGKNLQKHLLDQRSKGVSSVDAFAGLIQESLGKDKNYKALQAKLSAAKNDEERNATLEDMTSIVMKSKIGEMVPNRRAMMGLLSMIGNQGYMQNVRQEIMGNDVAFGGIVDRNFDFLSDENAFKSRQGSGALDRAEQSALGGLNNVVGDVAQKFANLANEYPNLIGGLELSVKALTALAGAAGLAAIAMGGKGIGPGGKVGGALRALGSGAASAGRAAGSALVGGAARIAATQGLSLATGAASAGAATTVAGLAAAGAGGYAAGKYIVAPAIDTGIEKATGGKSLSLGDWLYSLFHKDEEAQIEKMFAPVELPQKQVDINAQLQIGLDQGLVLKSQAMGASGGNVRMSTGNINTGAPS